MSVTRAIVIAITFGALTFVLAEWPVGVTTPWSLALGMLVAAVILPSALLSGAADANWEAVPDPPDTATDLQATMLASRLAEAANDPHRFVTRIRPRLRHIALATLRRRAEFAGLTDLLDTRAREALGPELHAVLTDDSARLPAPRRLAELLSRLEEP